MKTVFSDISTIAHMWAHQSQSNARNSGNLFFDGKTIYSYGYHFPIAQHTDISNTILFTLRTYSSTTAQHISVVSSAVSHMNKIYCYYINGTAQENFKAWLAALESQAAKLLKAKKPEIYLHEIERIARQVKAYARYKNIDIPLNLSVAMSITDKSGYVAYKANKDAIMAEIAAKEQKELQKRVATGLRNWRAFKTQHLSVRNGFDFLRFNSDKQRIETSQGVQIPLDIAKKFYKALQSGNPPATILDYDIKEITKNHIKVGCHTIAMSEINKFAKALAL